MSEDGKTGFCLARECDPLIWRAFILEFDRLWWDEVHPEFADLAARLRSEWIGRALAAQHAPSMSTEGSTA